MSELTLFKIEELNSIKSELHSMDKKIELLSVRFDDYLKNKCNEHTRKIDDLEVKTNKLTYRVAQITALSGLAGGIITAIVTKFIIK